MVFDDTLPGEYRDPNVGPAGRSRLSTPRSVLKPLRPSPAHKGRTAKPPQERAAPVRTPRRAGQSHGGGHSAHLTHAKKGTQLGQTQHKPRGEIKVPAGRVLVDADHIVELISPYTGERLLQINGQLIPVGHHPKADGKLKILEVTHGARHRRGQILSVSGSTATVRFGDTPDSPVFTLTVSPVITAAVLASATMAGVALWADNDPSDMLITTVL
jgi:hypothetical protein